MAAKRLILLPQDKGGIGKSFVAALLYDYLADQAVTLRAFDLDHANSTFHRLVPEAQFINTDVELNRLGVLDQLILALPECDVVLVDNRATGGTKVLDYLKEVQLSDLRAELDFDLIFLVIATDDKDANSQVADLVDDWGDQANWLVARNHPGGASPLLFDQSQSRQKLAALGAIEIEVPALVDVTRNRLQLSNLTVGRGRTAPALHLLDRSRCVRYHARMAEEFGKARGLLLP